jgi:2-phosphoglycerate kinase
MAKLFIIDSNEKKPVPFLRGILTSSLQNSGLSFSDAYNLAAKIRDELYKNGKEEITTDELRTIVDKSLKSNFGEEVSQSYQILDNPLVTILVKDSEDHNLSAFSLEQHQHCLESCGLSVEKSKDVSNRIYHGLLENSITEITSEKLKNITYNCIYDKLGNDIAQRYLIWEDFVHSDSPLLILIGGAPGSGKSSVASELATRLDIVRTQSSDMLREVMRMMIPKRLMPVLHTSSFMAWKELPNNEEEDSNNNSDKSLIDGYLTQAELVAVSCEAVIQRAIKERNSLILEGVHIQPSFLEKISYDHNAIVVVVMLGVLKPSQLYKRIRRRGKNAPDRGSERYLKNFDSIWKLQSFLLSEADRVHVPIIANDNKEKAIQNIIEKIIDVLATNLKR